MISYKYLNRHLVVKLIGKLQDGTIFIKKGHNGENEDELFEFKTDEGTDSELHHCCYS